MKFNNAKFKEHREEAATIAGIVGSLKKINSMVREMPRESTTEEAAELMRTAGGLMITICKFYEDVTKVERTRRINRKG